jgi:hypothetical protein
MDTRFLIFRNNKACEFHVKRTDSSFVLYIAFVSSNDLAKDAVHPGDDGDEIC